MLVCGILYFYPGISLITVIESAEGSALGPKADEEAYENEEQLATVTIVEDFDMDITNQLQQDQAPKSPRIDTPQVRKPQPTVPTRSKEVKSKKKKFRYESAGARKHARQKHRQRGQEKAEQGKRKRGK